jgi:hypothetical protein
MIRCGIRTRMCLMSTIVMYINRPMDPDDIIAAIGCRG